MKQVRYGAHLVLQGYWHTGRSFSNQVPPRLKITGLNLDKHAIRINLKSKKLAFRGATSLPDIRSRTFKKKTLLHSPLWHFRLTRGKSCNIYRKATWFPHSDRPIHILLITSPGVRGRRAGWGRYTAHSSGPLCVAVQLCKLACEIRSTARSRLDLKGPENPFSQTTSYYCINQCCPTYTQHVLPKYGQFGVFHMRDFSKWPFAKHWLLLIQPSSFLFLNDKYAVYNNSFRFTTLHSLELRWLVN